MTKYKQKVTPKVEDSIVDAVIDVVEDVVDIAIDTVVGTVETVSNVVNTVKETIVMKISEWADFEVLETRINQKYGATLVSKDDKGAIFEGKNFKVELKKT